MLNDFYRTDAWVKLRLNIIFDRLNEEGLTICEYCGEPIIHKYDIIAHHVIPLTESNVNDTNISLNPENIQLVHHVCHNKIHNKFGYKAKQIFIVYGAPLSGKTSYVNDVKQQGDLVIDMDSIWECITGNDRYIKPKCLNEVAFGIRDYLIDSVRIRRGRWNNCYIIGGYPLTGERERLSKALGARLIFIDCSKEECIERLKNDEERNYSEWLKYIEDWFIKFNR